MRILTLLISVIGISFLFFLLWLWGRTGDSLRGTQGFIDDKTAHAISATTADMGIILYWRRVGDVVLASIVNPVPATFTIRPNGVAMTTDFFSTQDYLNRRTGIVDLCRSVLPAFSAGRYKASDDMQRFLDSQRRLVLASGRVRVSLTFEYADLLFLYETRYRDGSVQLVCSVTIATP